MNKRQKKRELLRVCDPVFNADAKAVLNWLGNKVIAHKVIALRDDEFSASMMEVSRDCFKVSKPTRDSCERVKQALNKARGHLLEFYAAHPSRDHIRISLPRGNERRGEDRLKGRITLAFRDESAAHEGVIENRFIATGDVIKLWGAMVHANPVRDIFLLYDAPAVVIDPRRQWSGMGEVAAAFAIAECTTLIKPRLKVQVHRWCDTGPDTITQKHRCLIILGSSVKNASMRQLKKRVRWTQHQRFWFTEPNTKRWELKGCIYDRKPEVGSKPRDNKFHYKTSEAGTPETDYALVSFFKDDNNRQTLIALQGITTFGTLAAAQFMSSESGVRQLLAELQTQTGSSRICSFEMVLKVPLDRCVPLELDLENIKISKFVAHAETTF